MDGFLSYFKNSAEIIAESPLGKKKKKKAIYTEFKAISV